MTMGFQGQHRDKKRITYKTEGDGFQCDALCQDGFCYSFYMRNDPAPKRFLKQGLSPLHSRTMSLLDGVKDAYHQCTMDNLYMSASLCRAAIVMLANPVLTQGVTRKSNRGIPPSVFQEEVKNRSKQISVRGTVKAAIIMGDPMCTHLLATSVYDTKPVHYLSMASPKIEWVAKTKLVYNVDTGKKEQLRFLRLNQINRYNNSMGEVDIADQLRGSYRFNHWLRNRKWWWSLLFWGLGVILTNAYIVYTTYNEEEGVSSKNLLSQFEFRKSIALHWINPEYTKQRKRRQDEYEVQTKTRKGSLGGTSAASSLTMDDSLRASSS